MEREKWDSLYRLDEFYEGLVIKLMHRLQELVETSDTLLTLSINWEDAGILGSPFHKILRDTVYPFPLWVACIDDCGTDFYLL